MDATETTRRFLEFFAATPRGPRGREGVGAVRGRSPYFLGSGAHHQPHHLAMAKGEFAPAH